MKRFTLLTVLLVLAVSAFAAESSSALLAKAKSEAARSHKNILIIFHASWCGWCHRLDETFLADKAMAKLVGDSFVVVHLDVMENANKKSLENTGGEDLMKQWGGEHAGLPFMVVLSAKGEKLADSNRTSDQGSNIGYPAKPEEISHFLKMLKTAPRLTETQSKQIQAWLTDHAPKS